MTDVSNRMKKGVCTGKTFTHLAVIGLYFVCSGPMLAGVARYRILELGLPGGSRNYYETFSGLTGRLMNNLGTVAAGADTSLPDPFCFNESCLTSHAFEWSSGSPVDLGTLAFNEHGNFSQAFWINDQGRSVGISTYDKLGNSGEPLYKAVMWKDRGIIDLGTLGGEVSLAHAVNNRDQAVGWALNSVPASVNIWEDYPWPFATQQRAVLWENGTAMDLGTLGGTSAWATAINDSGQVIGQSWTAVSAGQPRQAAGWSWSRPTAGFLWDKGTMTDLGSLGGTFALPTRINSQGQVIGIMTVSGDLAHHPFLWENGMLTDLGTLGGSLGRANDINEAGEIVGGATMANGLNRAFFWKDGLMTNLGTLGTHSQAWHINSKSQVVGTSGTHPNLRAFLWENGGPMLDLNTLVPAGSPLLAVALAINNRGEILCGGPNEERLFLVVPQQPQLSIAPDGSGGYWLELEGFPDQSYRLERAANLDGPWETIHTQVAPASGLIKFHETDPPPRRSFYRIAQR
jgi:probable HAF family extracellular repeat protein